MTSGIFSWQLSRLHFLEADCASSNIMARLARLVPLPLVLRWRSRIVANVDSIGFVVRCRYGSHFLAKC